MVAAEAATAAEGAMTVSEEMAVRAAIRRLDEPGELTQARRVTIEPAENGWVVGLERWGTEARYVFRVWSDVLAFLMRVEVRGTPRWPEATA
jgi:hypothetical protein